MVIDVDNPMSEKCRLILDKGLTKDVCYDFRGIRRWVMCKAWEIMEKEKVPFRTAIRTAWDEAKKLCLEIGAPI